jgi:hypothetical protein
MPTSRLFFEISGDTKPLVAELEKAAKSLEAFEQKSTLGTKALVTSLENTINPTKKLAFEIESLGKQGYSLEQIWLKYGDALQKATKDTIEFGQAPAPAAEAMMGWAKSTGRVQDAIEDTSGSVANLGRIVQEFAQNPLQALQTGFSSLLGMLGPTAVAWGAIGAAAGAAVFSLAKFDEKISDEYIALKNTAAAAGLTVTQVQALDRMGVEAGVSMDKLARMFGMLNRELATGTKMDFVGVLNAMRQSAGETAADISGGVIPVLIDLDKRLATVTSETDKAQLMNAAFNRRLQDVALLLSSTHGHFAEYLGDMQNIVGYTPQQMAALQEQHDAIVEVGRAFESTTVKAKGWFAVQLQMVMQGMGHGIPSWTTTPFPAPAPAAIPVAPGSVQQLTAAEAAQAAASALAVQSAQELLAAQKRSLEYASLVKNGMLEDKELARQMANAQREYYSALERYFLTGENAEAAEAQWWSSKYERFKLFQSVLAPLNMALADAEQHYKDAEAAKDTSAKTGVMVWASEVNRIKELLEAVKKSPAAFDQYLAAQKEAEKNWDAIATKGHAALVPSAADRDKMLKPVTEDVMKALQAYAWIERATTRDVTQGLLNQLKLEQQITAQIVPRNEYERYQVELYKTGLDFAVREEEIRVKYAQKIYDLESRITFLRSIPHPIAGLMADQAVKQLKDVDEQMMYELDQTATLRSATILRIHAQEYKRMIDTYKQYAGELFDAIFESGKSGFNAILDWLKNDFKQLLKSIFQNVMAGALQGSGLYEGIRKLLAGTFPTGGPSAAGTVGGLLPGSTISSAVEQGVSSAFAAASAPQVSWNQGTQEWSPQTATGYSFVPSGLLSGLGAAGALTGGAGGGFSLASLLGAAGPAGLMMGSVAGVASSNPWAKAAGTAGLGLFGGAAAITAGLIPGVGATGITAALGGMLTNPGVLLAAMANPIVAIPLLIAIALPFIINAIKGKTAFEAGGMETSRDFGVKTGTDWMTQFLGNLKISEEQAYPIRKDILSSPQALTQMGGLAKQQGTYDSFLKSLEKVTTSWGTFNFRAAYEIGDVTGDWTMLDKAFTDAFASSKALQQNLPDWKDVLTITGDAAKKAAGEFESMWQEVQRTGAMTQELTDYLDDNAASLDTAARSSKVLADQLAAARAAAAKFTELQPIIAGFQGIKDNLPGAITETKTMYEIFLETGKILPELSAQILKYGGNLAAFQRLSDLAGLNANLAKGLQGIQELASGIASLQKTATQQVLAGEWGEGTWGELAKMGLDPSKLTAITDVTKFEKGWDQAIQDFQTKMKYVWDAAQKKYVQVPVGLEKGGLLEQALWKYGGAQGTTAIGNYAAGFNTVTPDLLLATKASMDAAYQMTIKDTLDYLGTAQDALNSQIESQTGAINEAKDDVVAELDLILGAINKIVLAPAAETQPQNVTIIVQGNVYADDFPNVVEKAVIQLNRRGSAAFAAAGAR